VTFQDPRTRTSALVRRARLRVVTGSDQGQTVDLPDAGVLIGSQQPAEMVLADSNVSRRHAEVRRATNGWILTDLGSTNGTFLGEIRVASVYLADGFLFRIGKTDVAFEARETGATLRASEDDDPGFIARSPAMREIVAAIREFAPSDLSIVLEGETGVGKEVVARAIHRASKRAKAPLVVVDCGALHDELVESELFGHERGAFTGAVDSRAGAFEAADGGTIFLDEIGELPLALQPKLLRALEVREVRRLGSNKTKSVDVRVLAATNRELPEEIAARTFRADLFFRLSEVRLRIPPLRERPQDVAPLAELFAHTVDPGATVSAAAADALAVRSWPGNVRELGNVMRRAAVAAKGKAIGPEHIAPADLTGLPGAQGGPQVTVDLGLPIVESREAVLAAFKRVYLEGLLARYGGDLEAVAKHAGVHPHSVNRLLRTSGLRAEGMEGD